MISFNGSVLKFGSSWLKPSLNPLNLPPYTMRFLFDAPFYDPTDYTYVPGTWTRVSTTPNIWDFTYSSTNWGRGTVDANTDLFEMQKLRSWCRYYDPVNNTLVQSQQNAYPWVHLLGFNSEGVTNMSHLFGYINGGNQGCQGFADVCIFDTSSVTDFEYFMESMTNISGLNNYDTHNATDVNYAFANTVAANNAVRFDLSSCTDASYMFYNSGITSATLSNTEGVSSFNYTFYNCTSLTGVPLLDTSAANSVSGMFYGCVNVETGALDLYNQLISQAVPPQNHSSCFYNCGSNTTTGAAELAQIPSSWGGTGA